MNGYNHILTVKIPVLPPSINDLYSGSEKKRVVKHMDNMTVGEIIKYWNKEAVEIIKKQMEKAGIKKPITGAMRVDISAAPRYRNKRYDLDNYLKMPLDVLVKAGLLQDDVAIVEIFAKRLPVGSGVVMSIFQIDDRNIYDVLGMESEAFCVIAGGKQKKKMTKYEKIEMFLKKGMEPNEFIPLGIQPPNASYHGAYIKYELNGIVTSEYINFKSNKELIQKLQYKKANREKLVGGKIKFKLIELEAMSYKKFLTKTKK